MNIGALALAVIAYMIVGFFWYSPFFLGKRWMKITDNRADKTDKEAMIKIFGLSAAAALLQAAILNYLMVEFDVRNIKQALIFSAMLWLGFSFTSIFVNNLYQQKKMELTFIDSGYQLAATLAMGAVIYLFL